jgi:hypothetical protein
MAVPAACRRWSPGRPPDPAPSTWRAEEAATVAELTLVQAFRVVAPLVGDPEVDAPRRAAMAVLYEKLRSMAGRNPQLEDAPAVVLGRLQKNGPRTGERYDRYDSDEKVEWYLRRALTNLRIDGVRGENRCRTFEEHGAGAFVPPGRGPGREPGDLARAGRELRGAFARLFGEILPSCKPATVSAIETRRRVAEGRATFDVCVAEASGEVTKQTRDAFYQRQSRAVRDLARAVEAYVVEHGLSSWETAALDVVFDELKDAEAGWPVGEGA